MKDTKALFITLLLALMAALPAFSQQKLRFHIDSFKENPLDLSAREAPTSRDDGTGELYAIIKVTSTDPYDDLNAYSFDFGKLKHVPEMKNGELWLYVQYGAKNISIARKGYLPVNRESLNTTLQPGRVYDMTIRPEAKKVQRQMLLFEVSPKDADVFITYKGSAPGEDYKIFGNSGKTDVSGMAAMSLELGTYTYRIISKNYHPSEGIVTLSQSNGKHTEQVTLRPNFAQVRLSAGAGAEIYINDEKAGTGNWSGILPAGVHSIECRKNSHKPSIETITVVAGQDISIQLPSPTPITGTVSVMSSPLGAKITIDGKDFGSTPNIIDNLIIGKHSVVVSKNGYKPSSSTVTINEGEITEVNVQLDEKPREGTLRVSSTPTAANIEINGKQYGKTPGTYTGLPVGWYTVTLSKTGYYSKTKDFYVEGDSTTNANIRLEPSEGVLEVTSSPTGATVEVRGKYYQTPATISGLPMGKYKVKVSKPGYRNAKRDVTITGGSNKEFFSLSYKRRRNFFKWFNIGVHAAADYGLLTLDGSEISVFGVGAGALLRIGNTESIFNLIGGARYWYSTYVDTGIQQMTYPIVLNWNVYRDDGVAGYIGVGYEFGDIISSDYEETFYCENCGGYHENTLLAPSQDIIFQAGASNRHLDWSWYVRVSVDFEYVAIGTGITYFF